MWQFIKWVFALAFMMIIAFLSLANSQFIEVNYLLGVIEWPLSLIIFLSFGFGVLASTLWILPRYYFLKWARTHEPEHKQHV